MLLHALVDGLHVCKELDYQLGVLKRELRRVYNLLSLIETLWTSRSTLEGLRVNLFNQIELLFVQNYLSRTSYLL